MKHGWTVKLVGAVASVTTVLAGAPWWAVVLVVLAVLLVVLAVSLVYLTALRMTYREVNRLASLPYPGTFKGIWGVELKSSSESQSPEPTTPETSRPKRWRRRKPP
jgi:cell division protein FtsW (lipid II flippase)